MLCRLTFALDSEGRTVHISEAERGASCGCVCPGCGEMLVARKGDETGHHFAHTAGTECRTGFDASLYYAVKRGLDELGYICLPAYVRNRTLADGGSGLHVLAPEAKVRVSRTELTRKGGVITGIAAYCGEKPLIIKLLTAYTTGHHSTAAVRAAGLPLVEIDFSRENELNCESVRKLLTGTDSRLYWVYNKRAEELWEAMTSQCEKLKVEGEDNAIFTFGCSVEKKRADGFRCYVKSSCAFCEYFFGLNGFDREQYLLCGRRNMITEAADLKLSAAERRKKYGIR